MAKSTEVYGAKPKKRQRRSSAENRRITTMKEPTEILDRQPPAVTHNGELALPGFELKAAGLVVVGEPAFEQWQRAGNTLRQLEGALHWCIGDWLLHGEQRKWGEKYTEAVEKLGFDEKTLRNDKWLADKIEMSFRKDKLTWNHHQIVAAIDEPERSGWLDKAEEQRWSVKELREEVRNRHKDRAKQLGEKWDSPHPVPDVEPGQWWQLGPHHIYCGDTSSEEFYSQLPDTSFAFADPPYNAGVDDWDEGFVWRHDWLADKCSIVAVTPGVIGIQDHLANTGLRMRWAVVCWITNGRARGAMGFGNYIHIPLFGHGDLPHHKQDFVAISLTPLENDDTQHKGRKPIELVTHLVELFSNSGDVVIDPFLGSGTTLVAAQAAGRVCIGGEIKPAFCRDTIRRWQAITGERANRTAGAEVV